MHAWIVDYCAPISERPLRRVERDDIQPERASADPCELLRRVDGSRPSRRPHLLGLLGP